MNTALQKHVQKLKLRIVNNNFRMRMSCEIAKKYDTDVYDVGIAEHAGCITELLQIGLQDAVFHTYLGLDDKLMVDFAKCLDIDSGKLLYTTDYQKDMLQKIKTTGKIITSPKEIVK